MQTILADVGGTNVRFARSDRPGELAAIRQYKVAAFEDFCAAFYAYRRDTGDETRHDTKQHAPGTAKTDNESIPHRIVIGAAGPLCGERIALTNADWILDKHLIGAQLGGAQVLLLNDLEAVAHALPHLDDTQVQPIGRLGTRPAVVDPRARRVAVNIGTGFGASLCAHDGERWRAVSGEAGHMCLALPNSYVLTTGAQQGEIPASIESVLSGDGVKALYRAVCKQRVHAADPATVAPLARVLSTAEILAPFDLEGSECKEIDSARRLTIDLLSMLIGQVAGDLVLASAAWGGAYLCGSVAKAWYAVGDGMGFRERFEAKSAMSVRMQSVFSGLVTHPEIGLLGLSHAVDET